MLVKGNSGFGIELVDESTIRKSARGVGGERLQRQIEKQVRFYADSQDDTVRTPKIFRTESQAGAFHADMEFIAAKDFVQFLSEADRQTLEDFLEIITGLIRRNLARCEGADVAELVQRKLVDLEKNNVPAIYIRAAESLCAGPVHVPVGPCHGDLTLSNILFRRGRLYLLDFLDCYVESPLQDIAKLRQDTCFGWSLELYQAEFNWAKIQIALRFLDRRIEAAFHPHEWYERHYELFQMVNLMRVLPYCTEAKTTKLITDSLDQMLG
jgi:tRNA A-37 threonylcarbamoyl transferase component Bud32